MGSFFQNFGWSGYTESKIYAFWFQKWPTDGPSYDNATKMFSIKNVCYQRINCETFFKLYGHWNVTVLCFKLSIVTKWDWWSRHFLVKIHVWYSRGDFVPNYKKIYRVEIFMQSHYLKAMSLKIAFRDYLCFPVFWYRRGVWVQKVVGRQEVVIGKPLTQDKG